MNTFTRAEVYQAIDAERLNQEIKWGMDKQQSLPGFLLVIEDELAEAKKGWCKNLQGKSAPLNELVQVAATCVAALERYGTTGSAMSTNDALDEIQVMMKRRNNKE